MNSHQFILEQFRDTALFNWLQDNLMLYDKRLQQHGDYQRWSGIIESLPGEATADFDLSASRVRVGRDDSLDHNRLEKLETQLLALHPWRKGPFDIFGIHIDSEWRSDWKWQRLAPHMQPLQGRRVLDIGCGNGYYLLRMLGAGARAVLGVDPMPLFHMQYRAVTRFIAEPLPASLLVAGVDDLPDGLACFDSVFSMGVLYHRRSPLDHLLQLRDLLRPGGELILETLVIDAESGMSLLPEDRYAKMRNVWFIPAVATLVSWLERCGFREVRVIDVSRTTLSEQRATRWMRFESLADFLAPDDPDHTIEGYPAPRRAVLMASR